MDIKPVTKEEIEKFISYCSRRAIYFQNLDFNRLAVEFNEIADFVNRAYVTFVENKQIEEKKN